jgi:WD40 repeat protein
MTGKTPFDAKELLQAGLDELRRTIREKEPARPSTRLRSLVKEEKTTAAKRRGVDVPKLIHLLSGDLDWIVMKCLEKDRTRRYDNASGLAVDIQRHLQNEPVIARPPSGLYRFQKLVRRNKLVFGAATAVVLTLAFGVVISSWQAIRAQSSERKSRTAEQNEAKQRQAAEEQREIAVEQRRSAEERARELRRLLYVGDMSKAFQATKEGDLGLANSLMRTYFDQPDGEDLRGWEWRYLWQLCQPSEHKLLANTSRAVNCVVFSPDGALLAMPRLDQTVRVLEVASGKTVTNLSGFDGKIDFQALKFSPQGRLLAAKGGHIVRVWNTETWQEIFSDTNGFSVSIATQPVLFSPDGKTLATKTRVAAVRKGIGFWDIQSGRLLNIRDCPDDWLGTVMTYSPDGKLLGLAHKNELQVWDARSLSPITNFTYQLPGVGWPFTFRVMSIAFSSNLMAAGYRLGEIKIWDTKTWTELAHWRAHPSWLLGLDFSPDGKLLASGGSDCRIQVWDMARVLKPAINSSGIMPQTTLQGHTDGIASVTFAPHSRSVASCGTDGTVRLWSLPSPNQLIPLFEPADDKLDWWFLEDGKHVIFTDLNSQFFLGDLSGVTAPQPLKSPKSDILDVNAVSVSPDGKAVALRQDADGSVQIWSLETGELKTTIRHEKAARGIAFAQGGRLFISSYNGEIRIEDLSGQRDERILPTSVQAGDSSQLTVSADGSVLADRVSRTHIGFWRLPDGQSLGTIDVPPTMGNEIFALSHDGRWLAYCSTPEKSLVLWDLISGQSRQSPMKEMTHDWRSMAFAPDGKTLVLVDSEATVFFWNVATLREITMEEKLAGNYLRAKFSPNGEYLALPLTLRRAPLLAEIEMKERAKAKDRMAEAKDAGK